MSKNYKVSLIKALQILFLQVKDYKFALAGALIGVILTIAATKVGVYRYLLPELYDKGLIAQNHEFLKSLLFLIPLIFTTIGIGEFMSKYFMDYVARSVVCAHRIAILEHLLLVPVNYFHSHQAGELISKVNYDSEQIASAVSDAFKQFLTSIIAVVFAFGVMLNFSVKATILVALVGPPFGFILGCANRKIRRYSSSIQKSMANIAQVASEVVNGYQVIKIYQGLRYESQRVRAVCELNRKHEMKSNFIIAISSPIIQIIGAMILVGFLLLQNQAFIALKPGEMLGFFGAMYSLLRPIKQLAQVNGAIQKGIVAINSIKTLLQEPTEPDTGINVLKNPHGFLEFKNISFNYPHSEQLVLKDISFSISPGQTIALVGKSGSGKSTIVSLLIRFYLPSLGQITIDGNSIDEYTLISLRENISLVTQNVVLFNDTIANNIAYGRRDKVSMDEIIKASKAAFIHDFIEQLSDKYDTYIGDNGCKLSGGQRQRLAIARAILKDAPILIFDEATSALDNESEKYVQRGIDNLKRGRTTIIIAHRLSTIENADKILVMEDGKIVEQGTHAELLTINGNYTNLHSTHLQEDFI
jgi:subfamily B ATP-binding cassette protein MsbA